MENYFGRGGIFEQRLTNFEFRPQQLALAEKIDEFLYSDGHLLAAEAPTGVGKTYAMLAPAMLWADRSARTVLVLTSGITLQEQLIDKDIPALLDVLNLDLPYGLLKGRQNYACIRKAREIGQEGYIDFDGDKGAAARDILEWLYETKTGDLSELALSDHHPARARIASSYQTCPGKMCPHYEHCFYIKALYNASTCRVLVLNYHVFFSYVLAQERPFPVPYALTICDEAHKMAEAARSVTRVTVTRDGMQRLLRRAPKFDRIDAALLRSIDCPADRFATRVADIGNLSESLFGSLAAYLPTDRNGHKKKVASYKEFPEGLMNDTLETIAKCDLVSGTLGRLYQASPDEAELGGQENNASLTAWGGELAECRKALQRCAAVENYPDWAYWFDENSLNCASVTAAPFLPNAFDPDAKVIALSATMTVDGSFDFWSKETGLVPDDKIVLDSPFDLDRQMEIDVVALGRQVGAPDYGSVVARVCRAFCLKNGGATLVLLSSWKVLNEVAKQLREAAPYDNLTIFVQGDLPKAELIARFKETDRSVLVGLASFREGIDIPGEALTQVIIDRVPFQHPDDPVCAARKELEGPKNFMGTVVPNAKMQLRQSIGRLIRSSTDRGKVVILDDRVTSRPAWRLCDALPVPVRKIRITGL